jgi:AraC-like DNA-binding protein
MIYTSIFINIILCLLLVNFQWRDQKAIIYLCFNLIIFNIRQLTLLLFNSQYDDIRLSELIFVTDPLTSLLGPMLFLYFKSLIDKKLYFNYLFFLFCIPSLLVFINLWPYYHLSFDEKLSTVTAIKNHVYVRDYPVRHTMFIGFNLQRLFIVTFNIGFFIYTFFFAFKANKNNIKSKNAKIIYSTLSVIFISSFPLFLFLLYANFAMAGTFRFTFLFPNNLYTEKIYLFTLTPSICILFFPKLIYGLNQSNSITNRVREKIRDLFTHNNQSIAPAVTFTSEKTQIIDYITKEKPYLNPTFSIHTVSKDLNIPHLQVSSSFNKEMGISFPEYRKRKRVEHAIELFKGGAHKKMSIEGVSLQSGFKNKSSFFLAFQSEFNMTPSEWITKNL